MRELSIIELDAVAGGYAGYDSCDYNSVMGVNVPIEDHGAYVEAQAQAAANSLWYAAQVNSQLDAFAKSVGLPNFNELAKQAAAQQQQTCQVDPVFANMMASPSFAQAMNSIVSASKASGFEYAINYYGDGHWSGVMTSNNPTYVNVTTSDIFNFFYGWADVVVHTHFDAQPGLSGVSGDIGWAERHDTPVMVIDYTASGGTQYYCYNPSTNQ